MEEMSGAEHPHFEIGQAVLVDQGLPGEITAVERGSAPGVMGGPRRTPGSTPSSPKTAVTNRPTSRSTTWWPRAEADQGEL